jgi:hypothetical protein
LWEGRGVGREAVSFSLVTAVIGSAVLIRGCNIRKERIDPEKRLR